MSKKNNIIQPAQIQLVEAPIIQSAEAPIAEKSAQRTRNTDTSISCPECKSTACFVVSAPRTHPHFIQNRLRRYKCRECNHAFKNIL